MNTTAGTLLGGRLRYTQPAEGYRTGLEPVLLAAAVPARAGDRVLEAGTGAGAGLLCLAARVAGIIGIGLERDAAMAALAAENFAANGFGDLTATPADLLGWQAPEPFDHAFANPPWHAEAGTPSPVPARRAAKRAGDGLLHAWTAALARTLRPRGTLTLILPAASLTEAIAALTAAKCPEVAVFPLWPDAGKPAKLMIIKATRLGKGPAVVHPGLALHAAGALTAAAEMVLRGGGGLMQEGRPGALPLDQAGA